MKNFKQQIGLALLLLGFFQIAAQEKPLNLNKPEREAWFTELGFGMFIHWSMDVQLGMVISHSMVGASTYLMLNIKTKPMDDQEELNFLTELDKLDLSDWTAVFILEDDGIMEPAAKNRALRHLSLVSKKDRNCFKCEEVNELFPFAFLI